jgi:hypothetical protein
MDMEDRTEPDEATLESDDSDAGREHVADRVPTDDEERAADEEFAAEDPQERQDVARHEKEMMEIGANVKGEGEID